jgi:MFS family permease
MAMIFVPIYLYNLGYSATSIMGYYLLFSIFWGFLTYPAMRFANFIGFNRAMGLGMLIQALQILMLATITIYNWPLWMIAFVWALFLTLYWAAFRACFARSLLHKTVGPSVGIAAALGMLAYGIAPAIGGAIATSFGIMVLYIIATLCFVAAAIPLFGAKEIIRHEPFNMKELNLRRIWRDLVANMGDNNDDSIGNILWPLFIFLIIPTYVGVGILSSISVIASILIALYAGRKQASKGTKRYLNHGTTTVSMMNVVRLFTQSAGQVAGVNFLNGLGHALMATPFNSRYYQNADREPLLPYVWAMITAGAVGNALVFGILLIVSMFASIQVVLLVGLALAIPSSYSMRLIRA